MKTRERERSYNKFAILFFATLALILTFSLNESWFVKESSLATYEQKNARLELRLEAPNAALALKSTDKNVKISQNAQTQNVQTQNAISRTLTLPQRTFFKSYRVWLKPTFAGERANLVLNFKSEWTLTNQKMPLELAYFKNIKANGIFLLDEARIGNNEHFSYTLNLQNNKELNLDFLLRQPLTFSDFDFVKLLGVFVAFCLLFGVLFYIKMGEKLTHLASSLARLTARPTARLFSFLAKNTTKLLKIENFGRFILENLPQLALLVVSNFILLTWNEQINGDYFENDCLIITFSLTLVLLYAIFLFSDKFAKKLLTVVMWLNFILFGVESFLLTNYQMFFTKMALLGIKQTDTQEAFEFITTYIGFKIVGIWLAAAAVTFATQKLQKLNLSRFFTKISQRFAVFTKPVAFLLFGVFVATTLMTAFYIYDDERELNKFNFTRIAFVSALDDSIMFANEEDAERIFRQNRELRRKFEGKIKSVNPPKKVILVIGESQQRPKFGKLYGYYLDSTPNLSALEKSGHLARFDNVIAVAPTTYLVLEHLFDFSNKDGVKSGLDMVSLFSFAGYKTRYISQQVLTGIYEGVKQMTVSKNADFLKKVPADNADILAEFRKNDEREFYVVHLMGAHLNYDKRYPKSFDKFKPSDLTEQVDDSNWPQAFKKQLIAGYSNANLFTDYLVNEIWKVFKDDDAVLLFLSDHGDVVFDKGFEGFAGHSKDYKLCYEIPFVILMSDTYKAKRPELFAAALAAKDRPFVNDDTIHVLATLGGVKTPEYSASRDILSPEFNVKRKRLVGAKGVDYDKMVK